MAALVVNILVVVFSVFSLGESNSAISTTVTIVLSSEDEIVTTRSTVLLVCVAHGNPAPSISWLFDGSSSIDNETSLKHTIYEWPSFSSSFNYTESILEICSVGFEDGGLYTCHASNGEGTITNSTTLTVLENGEPSKPNNCSSIAVYRGDGTLLSIDFNWTKVATPQIIISGINPNVTEYHVSVEGLGTHSVPVESVCSANNGFCSYSYPVTSFILPRGRASTHVAARNELGLGRQCSFPMNSVGQTNMYVTAVVTPRGNTLSVACSRGPGIAPEQSFECQFCYSSESVCPDHVDTTEWSCRLLSDTTGAPTSLSVLTAGAHCYQVSAIVDGRTAAMVRDVFYIAPDNDDSLVATLSVSILTSAIIAFALGLLLGTLVCLCGKKVQRRKSQLLDGGSNQNGNRRDVASNEVDYYETIPMDVTKQNDEIRINHNSAYGQLN